MRQKYSLNWLVPRPSNVDLSYLLIQSICLHNLHYVPSEFIEYLNSTQLSVCVTNVPFIIFPKPIFQDLQTDIFGRNFALQAQLFQNYLMHEDWKRCILKEEDYISFMLKVVIYTERIYNIFSTQPISYDVRLFLICLSPPIGPGTGWPGGFWSKSVWLKLANLRNPFMEGLLHSGGVIRGGFVAVAVGVSDRWQVTGDKWQVTCDF